MAKFSFRARLFITLLTVSAFPLAMVTVAGVWALHQQPKLNPDQDIYPVGRTEVELSRQLGPAQLPDGMRSAWQRHDSAVERLMKSATQTRLSDRTWQERAAVALVISTGFFALVVVAAGVMFSRQYAAPLNEIVDWTRRIQRHEPLPQSTQPNAPPELVTLQRSLYQLQQGLEQARAAELEAERLRAFGEVARRVAHEMKNPLTPIRLAVMQLSRRAPPEWREELEVIAAESARLEAMAKDFAELGRLPEGVAAPVDLCELLEDLLRSAVPDEMRREFHCEETGITLVGHYDPLRRAFSNIVRNAVEACNGQGVIDVTVRRDNGRIRVALQDSGPGIDPEKHELIFQPYYTEKRNGTGLGLAIVRQTIEQHGGSIAIGDAPGGAVFLVDFPS